MASYTAKRLVNPTQLTASPSTIYTVAGVGVSVAVKQIMISNVSGTSANFSMHIVPSGGIASSSNLMSPALAISPSSFITIDIDQVLVTGDIISAFSSSAGALNVMISGYEVVA